MDNNICSRSGPRAAQQGIMSSVEFDGTCIGPTAGDLVPGSRRSGKKKKSAQDLKIIENILSFVQLL